MRFNQRQVALTPGEIEPTKWFLAKMSPQVYSYVGNGLMNDIVTFVVHNVVHNPKLWPFVIHTFA